MCFHLEFSDLELNLLGCPQSLQHTCAEAVFERVYGRQNSLNYSTTNEALCHA
jgi:hypothetical protein